MELIKDTIKVDDRVDFGKVQTFIESEVVVPDKKDDVYQIIKSEGYISIKKVEVSDSKVTCRGHFNYNIIYLASDKKTISNIDGKIDINEVFEKENASQNMDAMLFAEVEHIDSNIMNERKIKIGTLANVRGSLFKKQRLDIVKDITQIDCVQKSRKEKTYLDIVGIEKGESAVKDSININSDEIDSIISLNPCVKVKDSRVTDNKVIIGGCVEINPLALTNELEIVELDKIGIDFTQFIEMPSACEGMKEEVLVSLGDFNYNFKKSEGTNSNLEIDCTVCCVVKVIDEVNREVLKDAYSPQKVLKFDYKTADVNKLLSSETESFNIRDSIRNSNNSIKIKDIVSSSSSIWVENSYIENEKNIIQGIVKIDILYTPVEGLEPIYKISEEIPFEHEVTIEGLDENCRVFNNVLVEKLEADLNKDEIDLNIKIKRYTEAIIKKVEKFIINGEDLGDYDLSKAPSLIVYLCKEGDTLWDVAKRYNTTEEEIAQINELKLDEPLTKGKCLILEKKVVLFD